jgi:hypothetical protein
VELSRGYDADTKLLTPLFNLAHTNKIRSNAAYRFWPRSSLGSKKDNQMLVEKSEREIQEESSKET